MSWLAAAGPGAARVVRTTAVACVLAAAPVLAAEPVDGHAVFQKWCAMCHSEGLYMAGTQKLLANYEGQKPALLERRTDLTPEFVKVFVRRGNGVMPRFRKTEVSDAALDAVATYLARNNPDLKPPAR